MLTDASVTSVSAVTTATQAADSVSVADVPTSATTTDAAFHVVTTQEECTVKGVLMVTMATHGLAQCILADHACVQVVREVASSMVTRAVLTCVPITLSVTARLAMQV